MAAGTETNINCTRDLTGAIQALSGVSDAGLGFDGTQAVIVETIADGDYVLAAGDTFTVKKGLITAITPA